MKSIEVRDLVLDYLREHPRWTKAYLQRHHPGLYSSTVLWLCTLHFHNKSLRQEHVAFATLGVMGTNFKMRLRMQRAIFAASNDSSQIDGSALLEEIGLFFAMCVAQTKQ